MGHRLHGQATHLGRQQTPPSVRWRTWLVFGGRAHRGPFGTQLACAPAECTATGTPTKANTMSEKSASVLWTGAGKKGQGQISTETGALLDHPYGFASRFGDDVRHTNPEEILGAAHAACFTMAFSFACEKAGFTTRTADTQARVRLTAQGDGFLIDRIALTLRAVVPGLDEARFQQLAQAAKNDCPLSKALAGVPEITLTATLDTAAGDEQHTHANGAGGVRQRADSGAEPV